ncbi:MAG TPA: pitrilysin family protein, partial [Polyangia bacterium]
MRSIILVALVAATATATAAAPKGKSDKNAPQMKQWQLPNGLTVIFVPDHKAPVVTVQVFYHAGGKDEPAGKRGIAHMFEHMMFKGSTHVPPEEHARFIQLVGGENNAFTEDDTTGYHDTIPPSALDFTLKLEAERMRNLKLTQKTIDSERQVVEEELRLRVDNNPIGKALKAELAQAYTVHPYQISAAGEKKDLDTVTPADCQKFYDEYYRPNNAALVVVGDTDEATVKALADKYFGPLEKGPPPRHDAPKEPEQTAERDKTLELAVQLPIIIGGYHIPAGDSPDLFALEVLQRILSGGESSRLHQRLVRKDKTAVAAGGFVFAHEDPGLFLTFALYLPNMDAAKLKSALDEEIAKISTTKVDARELQKAKNQLAAQAVYQRERVSGLASNIGVDWVVAHDPTRPF